MAGNGKPALIAMILLAGAIVMTLFIFLAGTTDVTPFNNTYFLSANTESIQGAKPISQWTYFYICGSGNRDCSGPWPDPPVGWAWSAGATGAPSELIGEYGDNTTNKYYFYIWRFGWVFSLIGLVFAVAAFFGGVLACCGRLGAAIAALASIASFVFYSLAVSLMTDCFVKMRDVFNANGYDASLGIYAFGFAWGSWAAVLLATGLFCLGTRSASKPPARRKSVRSTHSSMSRRVKEDYA